MAHPSIKSQFAKKSLGQNFLVDESYVRKIVSALDLNESDTVIEIGPGRGAITESLVESGAKVIAVELDRDLVPMLRGKFAVNDNFSVIEADATQVDFQQLLQDYRPKNYGQISKAKLVANLPYYISTPILQHLSTQRHLFDSLVLMFQREVVDRIAAKPGDSDRGFLTVLVDAAFSVDKLFDVPPTAFSPIPKVTSSVARFIPKRSLLDDEQAFRDLISTAFGQKRKTILNNLKAVHSDAKERLERSGIDPQRRAESLTLDEWLLLLGGLEGSR
jgi:16S rRNA (adenine1518-N6/adenine1519-N6)-dimethyltransferase